MCKVNQVHAVFLAVDCAGLRALLAIVNDNLVVLAARNQRFPAGGEVDAVDLVGVLAEHLGHAEAAYDLIHEFHLHLDGV